nr:response regulator transcription factor [Anaerolineae bacterium]
MIRIIIVDDHAVLRSGLRLLINREPDMTIVAEAGDGKSAIEQIESFKPDVILMDITLPDMWGTDVIRHFKLEKECRCQFLALTMHCEDEWLRTVLDAGASGYVVKSVADDELLDAIRAVHRGHSFLRSEAVAVLLDDSPASGRPEDI